KQVGPHLDAAIRATTWLEREQALNAAAVECGRIQNDLGLHLPVDTQPRRFANRPFFVPPADEFETACRDAISDPNIRALDGLGAIDQYGDSTDLLSHGHRPRWVAGWRRAAALTDNS